MKYKLSLLLKIGYVEEARKINLFFRRVYIPVMKYAYYRVTKEIDLDYDPQPGDILSGYGFGQLVDRIEVDARVITPTEKVITLECKNDCVQSNTDSKGEMERYIIEEMGWTVEKEVNKWQYEGFPSFQ